MKKNMEQLTLWMKTHKKKVAACMAVILLALGALGIGLAGMQKENQKSVVAKADQKKKVSQPDTFAPAQKNDAPQTTGGSNASNSGSGGKQNAAPVHTHNYNSPLYAQQWVVDQAAWTETVSEPVYEMVEIAVGNQSGLEIVGDPNEYLLNNMNGDTGWHSEWIRKQTGTNTYTVPHPEQGHYESVVIGYQCSCGAVQ